MRGGARVVGMGGALGSRGHPVCAGAGQASSSGGAKEADQGHLGQEAGCRLHVHVHVHVQGQARPGQARGSGGAKEQTKGQTRGQRRGKCRGQSR